MRFYLPACLVLVLLFHSSSLTAQSSGNTLTDDRQASVELLTPQDFYKAGQFQKAAELFLEKAGRGKQRVDSFYNSARCYHQDYTDNHSIESLVTAVNGYYRVLELDPQHKESLINLELARIELEKLETEKEQQEKSRDKENQNDGGKQQTGNESADSGSQETDQPENELSSLAGEQRDLAESDQDDENRRKQSSLNERTRQAMDQSEADSPGRESLEQALDKQREALEQMSQGDQEKAREAQQDAASLLEQAAQAASESEDQGESDALPDDIQSILNQEQARNQDNENSEDRIRVEKNW